MTINATEEKCDDSAKSGYKRLNKINPGRFFRAASQDEDPLDSTRSKIRGGGILASSADVSINEDIFADGCKLLLASARGDLNMVERLLRKNPTHTNFRDYDRRTALHVAASEGHLKLVEFLVRKGANVNRSDRWGGSPLDDAHRHQQTEVVAFLRKHGGTTGSADQTSNLITAAAVGDLDESLMLIHHGNIDINQGDYDKRTPLHLACGEGHILVVRALIDNGANVNVEDRWGGTPLDDAKRCGHLNIVELLKQHEARPGSFDPDKLRRQSIALTDNDYDENLVVDISEVEMIERIGSGAFGEIYKCRWRGTYVAAKCIKSAKIRKEWLASHSKNNNITIEPDASIDNSNGLHDDSTLSQTAADLALSDFRQETAILSKLRHPNICMLLAFSTTADHEVMISELMKCSLLDVFKANSVQNVQLSKRTQTSYANQLAKGMNYLHTCKPPIIHRDLKPANLLIDYAGTLKITDFGLAKVRPDPNRSTEQDQFLMTGETGSYRFMAPEVFRHEQYTETVDTYSFAMILYYIFSGTPPWHFLSGLDAVITAALDGSRPDIPRAWDIRMSSMLRMCWDENPQGRPSFGTILEIIREYSENVFGTDGNSVTLETEKPTKCCSIM